MTDKIKQQLQACFSKAAANYDAGAYLQQHVAQNLLAKLSTIFVNPKLIIDIGSGTGFCSRQIAQCYPQAIIMGIDLAYNMVQVAQAKAHGNEYHCWADFDALPISQNNADIIFSNLALQWSFDLSYSIAVISKVLKPNGYFLFSTLIKGSLAELAYAKKQINKNYKTNKFLKTKQIEAILSKRKLAILHSSTETIVAQFDNIIEVIRSLKNVGANYNFSKQQSGIDAKNYLSSLAKYYPKDKTTPAKFSLSYKIAYFIMVKK